MRTWLFGGVIVSVVALIVGVWRRAERLAAEQFVTLTEKRQAELLDVERRQHEE